MDHDGRAANAYGPLLRLLDTREAGPDFPDMLGASPRTDRLRELGLSDPTDTELAELRSLRDALIPVVWPDSRDASIEALNQLLVRFEISPRLEGGGATRQGYLSRRDGRVAELAAAVLGQAIDLFLTGDVDRVGICAADGCAAPFVDAARGRSRRYCSARCSTRTRVRNFRTHSGDPEGTSG